MSRAGLATAATRAATATAAASSAAPAGLRTPRPPRSPLRLVPPLRTGAPRAPFVVLLGTLLVGGLAGLLYLHTALAEDSFRLHDLKNRSALLSDREQALEQQVALEAAPRRLAAKAEALGMVRSENPVFIRLSDGKVLGRPKAGVAPPPATSQPSSSPPSSTPSSPPSTTSSGQSPSPSSGPSRSASPTTQRR